MRPRWQKRARPQLGEPPADWGAHTPPAPAALPPPDSPGRPRRVSLDRTAKLYIGGKQARPDGNYTRPVISPSGFLVGQAGDGNRKDLRNAVEAAHKAKDWATYSPHNRAQILYYIAENLSARAEEFAGRIAAMTDAPPDVARAEVALSIERLFHWAAYADKSGGMIQETTCAGSSPPCTSRWA